MLDEILSIRYQQLAPTWSLVCVPKDMMVVQKQEANAGVRVLNSGTQVPQISSKWGYQDRRSVRHQDVPSKLGQAGLDQSTLKVVK